MHTIAAVATLYVPAPQTKQSASASWLLALVAASARYDPAGHVEQLDASARAYEPALQAVQPRAAVDPAFVTVPANPGAQIVHAETDVLPRSEPAVEMPVGQAVQLVAPSAA